MTREGQHPLMASCGSDHCVTCSDEGVPMRVESFDAALGLACCVDGAGERRSEVMTALLPGVRAGDTLLVHAGTALARLTQGEVI